MIHLKQKAKLIYTDDTTIVIELRPEEVNLLNVMRNKCRFGKMEITVRDGIPIRVEKAVESINLTNRE